MSRLRLGCRLLAAAAASAGCLGGHDRAFLLGWLVAWGTLWSLAIGALLLDMTLAACGASWQVVLRRPLECLHAPLPELALLFLPLAWGAQTLYPWAAGGAATIWPRQALPFAVESAVALVATALLGSWLRRLSRRQDGDGSLRLAARRRVVASAGLPPVLILASLGGADWFQSLDPRLSSSIYGLTLLCDGCLGAVAGWILLVLAGSGARRLPITRHHLTALGRLCFAFALIAAYIAFSQFLIMWMGDLPDDAAWLLPRVQGWAGALIAGSAVVFYGLPLTLLLVPRLSCRPPALAGVAGLVLVGRLGAMLWYGLPGSGSAWPAGGWAMAVLAALAIPCALAAWDWRRGVAATPQHAPELAPGIAYDARLA